MRNIICVWFKRCKHYDPSVCNKKAQQTRCLHYSNLENESYVEILEIERQRCDVERILKRVLRDYVIEYISGKNIYRDAAMNLINSSQSVHERNTLLNFWFKSLDDKLTILEND